MAENEVEQEKNEEQSSCSACTKSTSVASSLSSECAGLRRSLSATRRAKDEVDEKAKVALKEAADAWEVQKREVRERGREEKDVRCQPQAALKED